MGQIRSLSEMYGKYVFSHNPPVSYLAQSILKDAEDYITQRFCSENPFYTPEELLNDWGIYVLLKLGSFHREESKDALVKLYMMAECCYEEPAGYITQHNGYDYIIKLFENKSLNDINNNALFGGGFNFCALCLMYQKDPQIDIYWKLYECWERLCLKKDLNKFSDRSGFFFFMRETGVRYFDTIKKYSCKERNHDDNNYINKKDYLYAITSLQRYPFKDIFEISNLLEKFFQFEKGNILKPNCIEDGLISLLSTTNPLSDASEKYLKLIFGNSQLK